MLSHQEAASAETNPQTAALQSGSGRSKNRLRRHTGCLRKDCCVHCCHVGVEQSLQVHGLVPQSQKCQWIE